MEINVEEKDDIAILEISGNINVNSSPILMKQLQELISGGSKKILLNMAGVTFLSSSAIGTIAGTFNDLKDKGGQLKLVSLTKDIKHIFEITGLDKRIPIVANIDDALASF